MKNNNLICKIGLEVHCQLKTTAKLFSSISTSFGSEYNSQVSLVDAAFPGTLPVLNKKCVNLAVKAALVLEAKINNISYFDRKNYFYPDLPQGYQISQIYTPLAVNGKLLVKTSSKKQKVFRINRIHIEQDAGKILYNMSHGNAYVDLNRAGIPLIEIVTEMDFTSYQEVITFLHELRLLFRYNDISLCSLEEGSMRCDVNISLQSIFSNKLGNRVELKNLNSFASISKAILFEFNRQKCILEKGNMVDVETRSYDDDANITKSMRKKEYFHDYRYFRDPDLPQIFVKHELIENIKNNLEENPESRRNRYINNFNISEYYAILITNDIYLARFFDIVSVNISPILSANWLCTIVLGKLKKINLSFANFPISEKKFVSLLKLVESNRISSKVAKMLLDKMLIHDVDPLIIVKEENLEQISDETIIIGFINMILHSYRAKVIQYVEGKTKLYHFFVGKVMEISNGKINPVVLKKILHITINNFYNSKLNSNL